MSSLPEVLNDAAKKPAVIADCLTLIDAEVSDKGGFSGLAIKAGYAAVKGVKPGFIRDAVESLLPDFSKALDPIFQEAKTKCVAVSTHFTSNASRVADALLAEDHPEVRAALESLAANEGADPLLATDRAQLRDAIRVALDYLPAPYGDILEWKYLRDMSIGEIASRLGRSPKAAESLLTRAREAFREAFSLIAQPGTTGNTP